MKLQILMWLCLFLMLKAKFTLYVRVRVDIQTWIVYFVDFYEAIYTGWLWKCYHFAQQGVDAPWHIPFINGMCVFVWWCFVAVVSDTDCCLPLLWQRRIWSVTTDIIQDGPIKRHPSCVFVQRFWWQLSHNAV